MKTHKTKRRLSAACHYAYTRLALNYYMYYEVASDGSLLNNKLKPLIKEFHELLSLFLNGERKKEGVDALRERVIHEMEVNTAYTDAFQAYEYVFNRLEERFEPQLVGAGDRIIDEENATAEIMSFITDTEDPMVVRERVQSVLGQLPVRLTKKKFFSIITEALKPYVGAEKESLESLLYVLRSEALLNRPQDMEQGYEELYSIRKECAGADYKDMTPEDYRRLVREIERAGEILMDNSGEIMLLMDLVNDLYVLFLSRDAVFMDVKEEQRLNRILEEILHLFEKGESEPIPQSLTDMLSLLEGKQELYFEQWMRESSEPEDQDEAVFSAIELLMSGSSFMSLKEERPERGELVDEAVLKGELDQFFLQLSASFAEEPKQLVRAVMAKILSRLPIFFKTLDEVQDFIQNSLESCGDEGEKLVSLKLIRLLAELDESDMDD